MAAETPMKDMSGRSLGMLRTGSSGDQLILAWLSQKILGKFRKASCTAIGWKPQGQLGKDELLPMLPNNRQDP